MKANEAPEKIYLQVCGDCPQTDCDGNCEEEIGIKEPISKTFPRVNEFEVGSSYRR